MVLHLKTSQDIPQSRGETRNTNFPLTAPWQHRTIFCRILSILIISMRKTPTYGHLLVDILQGIAKRNALLQVAGESVNPLIWTCLKIRHAGPQGSKSPKNRRSCSSARGECGSGWGCIWEDPTAGTHRQNPPRQSELRGFMSTGAFMNLSLSQKVSPTPTPISAEIRAISAPQPTPLGKKREGGGGGGLRHSSVSRTIPSKPIHPLPSLPFPGKWWAFSQCFCIKVHQNGLCSEKRFGEPKYFHCFKDFDPLGCTWP